MFRLGCRCTDNEDLRTRTNLNIAREAVIFLLA